MRSISMAARVPVAGACGHRSGLPAPLGGPATQPPSRLPLHSLQNQAAASECASSQGEGREGGARGARRRRGARRLLAS